MMRRRVADEAASWVGTPYHHQGTVKGAGVDCAMLLIQVYHACGLIPNIDPRPYPTDWMLHRHEELFLQWLAQYGEEIESPKMGDVVVWRIGRTFSHGAVVTDDNGSIVHAYLPARIVTTGHLADSDLVGREARVFKVRGIE